MGYFMTNNLRTEKKYMLKNYQAYLVQFSKTKQNLEK